VRGKSVFLYDLSKLAASGPAALETVEEEEPASPAVVEGTGPPLAGPCSHPQQCATRVVPTANVALTWANTPFHTYTDTHMRARAHVPRSLPLVAPLLQFRRPLHPCPPPSQGGTPCWVPWWSTAMS
jgi:hypothetical protein